MQLDHKKYPVSCLLDLSALFDTIDHDILITRLSSWFGIHGSVLNWFKSYLSSRCFRVKCSNSLSSRTSSWRSSRFCPRPYTLHHVHHPTSVITLSTLISTQSLNHHIYADDTQLFFSFYPPDLHSSISHLQNALAYNKFLLG